VDSIPILSQKTGAASSRSEVIIKSPNLRRWILRITFVAVGAALIASWFGVRWEKSEQAAFLESGQTPPGEMVSAGEHELHVVAEGTDEPGVLFISGMGDNYKTWDDVQDRIASVALTVSYDRPGLGWSPPSEDDLTLDAAVEDMYLLVSGSGLFAEPPILVGHSLGGAFARRFAHRYPDAVSGLVLLDPTPTFYLPTAMRVIMGTMMQFNSLSSALGIARHSLYSRNPDASRDRQLLWGHLYASSTHAREVRREYQGAAGSEPILPQKDGLGGLPLAVLFATSVDYPPGFSSIAQVMDEARRRMAEESTQGRLVEADTGHYIHYDDTDLVVEEVLKMIDVVVGATSETVVQRP